MGRDQEVLAKLAAFIMEQGDGSSRKEIRDRDLADGRQLTEARRVIKRLIRYLTHDAGCAWVKTSGDEVCSCEYAKLYLRVLKLGIRMGDGIYEFVPEHTECRNEQCSLEINQGEEGFMTQSGTFCRWKCYLKWEKALEGE